MASLPHEDLTALSFSDPAQGAARRVGAPLDLVVLQGVEAEPWCRPLAGPRPAAGALDSNPSAWRPESLVCGWACTRGNRHLEDDHRNQLFGTLPGAASVVPGARWRSRLCRDVQFIKIRSPHSVASRSTHPPAAWNSPVRGHHLPRPDVEGTGTSIVVAKGGKVGGVPATRHLPQQRLGPARAFIAAQN